MIALLLLWLYAGALCLIYGRGALALLGRWLKLPDDDALETPLAAVLGLILLTSVAAALSLFIPLGLGAAVLLLALGLALLALGRPSLAWRPRLPRGTEWLSVVILLLALLFSLENGTHAPANPDTNAYHAQAIRWIETYPAVPGLGNLNARFAFNSDWFVLNAAFSFAFLGLRSFHIVAGLLFLVSLLFFVRRLEGLLSRPSALSGWLALLFIPAAFWILGVQLSSPGNDLPVILLTWLLFTLALETQASSVPNPVHLGLLAVIPPYMVTLKLTAAPLLLFAAYALLRLIVLRNGKLVAAVTGLIVLILAPWLARSVVQSGYLVFPFHQVDLFSFDWKMPPDYVDAARGGIIGFARLPGKDWLEAVRLPYQVWIPQWLGQQTRNQLAVLAVAALSPLAVLFRPNRPYALPILFGYIALLVWFFAAPNLRFGYGVVLGLAVFAVSSLLALAAGRLPPLTLTVPVRVLSVLMAVFLLLSTTASIESRTLPARLVLPLDYYPSKVVPCPLDGLSVYCAALNQQCSYAAFPCVTGLPVGVRARGSLLQDGFYSVR